MSIETRVSKAAEAALAHHRYVSTIDILMGMQILKFSQVEDWRKGRLPYLESVIMGALPKILRILKAFQNWAKERQLLARETVYLARTKGSKKVLQFSKSNLPHLEKLYRTHFISPSLVQIKKEKREAPSIRNFQHR